MPGSWRIEDAETGSAPVSGSSSQGLVSLNFLRATLLRRWRQWVGAAVACAALGLAYVLLVPAQSIGTVTLYLAHEPGSDPNSAIGTDVSLLRTRAVAQQLIDRLSLDSTPEDLHDQITVNAETPTILSVTIPAPDDVRATRRAELLAETYLDFRADQLRTQAQAVIDGEQVRVGHLQQQINQLTDQYDDLVGEGTATETQLAAILTQRAELTNQISTLQQDIEQTSLDVSSVITASHVVDPAAVEPHSTVKRAILATGSGFIGGLGLGVAAVLVLSLASERLRRRDEVALALGAPVRFSLRRETSLLPWRRGLADHQVDAVVAGMDQALLPDEGRHGRFAVVSAGRPAEAAQLLLALAARLAERGVSTSLVDQTRSGHLNKRARPETEEGAAGITVVDSDDEAPIVLADRDRTDRSTDDGDSDVGDTDGRERAYGDWASVDRSSRDRADRERVERAGRRRQPWEESDVVLVLGEVDLGLGVSHLSAWADQAVLVVECGGSSAESLRTTARLFRSGGPELAFAVLTGADPGDESNGLVDAAAPPAAKVRRGS